MKLEEPQLIKTLVLTKVILTEIEGGTQNACHVLALATRKIRKILNIVHIMFYIVNI